MYLIYVYMWPCSWCSWYILFDPIGLQITYHRWLTYSCFFVVMYGYRVKVANRRNWTWTMYSSAA
jgi:hypothetical protein